MKKYLKHLYGGCMKKLIAVVAVLSFAIGLNASNLKEDIYNSNPLQFDNLVKELQDIHNGQVEEFEKAYQKEQTAKAIKAVLADKEILKNYSSAVIKDGVIIKLSRSNEDDGISFWHEHSPNVENAQQNVCKIYDPSWDNINTDSPCGVTKYQMSENSIYAGSNALRYANVRLLVNTESVNDFIGSNTSNTEYNLTDRYPTDWLYGYESEGSPAQLLRNFELITDTVGFAGYSEELYGTKIFQMPNNSERMFMLDSFSNVYDTYYAPTEYDHDGNTIFTLRSGTYISMLSIFEKIDGVNISDSCYVILKWFPLTVENYYLGDVSVKENNKNNGAEIGYNNREIKVTFADSVNPKGSVCSVYDMNGRRVLEQALSSQETIIPVPDMAKGAYVIKVLGNKVNATRKIVK